MINFLVILSLLCFSWEPNFVHATYKYATYMVWADMSGCKKLLRIVVSKQVFPFFEIQALAANMFYVADGPIAQL